MRTYIIDLQDYRTPGSKVFTGRDRGSEVRSSSSIDNIVSQFEKIVLRIPAEIRSINPSFLEEFLHNVVIELGKEKFKSKFEIENPGRYKVEDDLNMAIDRILREENALS